MSTRIAAAEARCGPEQTNNNERSGPDLQIRRRKSRESIWRERVVSQRRTSSPLGGISNFPFMRLTSCSRGIAIQKEWISQRSLATTHQLLHHMRSAVSRAPCREEARNSGQVIPGRHQSFLPVLTAPCLRMSDGCHQGIAEAFLPHGVLRLATLGYIDCRRLPGAAVVNHAVDNR